MNNNEKLYWNNNLVNKMKNKIKNYDEDSKIIKRKEKCECKYCTYINNDRIAGQAFTSSNCKGCNKKLDFPSTDTDEYCLDCAKKINVCKHCGSEMD